MASRFNYLSASDLASFIHTMSGVTNTALAEQFISDAERIVDAYVGSGPKFYSDLTLENTAVISAEASAVVQSITFGNRRPNYWAKGGLYVELLDVPGNPTHASIGQKRLAVASTSGQVTLVSGYSVDVPANSTLYMSQESVFPRIWDSDPLGTPRLPDQLDVAVAWQVEYGILFGSEAYGLGDADVATDEDATVQSRTYASGYSETRLPGQERGLARFVSPKVRAILRDIINSTGYLRGNR